MSDALTVLSSHRANSTRELSPLYIELEEFYTRKLWHQLTNSLFKLFKSPDSQGSRLTLFTQFIQGLESVINTLAFVSFAVAASEELSTLEESLAFLQSLEHKLTNHPKELLFLQLKEASVLIKLQNISQSLKIIENSRHKVDELEISDKVVLAQFYLVSCEFFKSKMDYTNYYRNALLYLACVPLDQIPLDVQAQRAFDLCVSALLADKIYNFGELVQHPILQSLNSDIWLKNLVFSVNSGDVPEFQKLKPEFTSKSLILAQALPFLEQKICLMALCECVFKQQNADCELKFSTIAKETHLQAGAKVEILVMKAFSLGLIKGSIDEVSKTVRVTWLQPRALNTQQIEMMRERLGEWDLNVKNLATRVHEQGSEVWQAV